VGMAAPSSRRVPPSPILPAVLKSTIRLRHRALLNDIGSPPPLPLPLSGIATTLYPTGQQWDWPNGWPPLQHMLIEGARRSGGNVGREFACSMARTWLK